jgi:hypothetical protein
VEADFWLNFNTSGGTTEFGGGAVGFDPMGGRPIDGASFLGSTDGDTARDYRLFKDGTEQFIESGQFAISTQDNSQGELPGLFPGQTVPAAQGDGASFNPTNVIVTAADGTLAFAWHRLTIDVDSDAGTAQFFVNDVEIGTIDSSVGAPVDLTGPFALTFADLFTSVSTKPAFSFGVFDNVVVTQVPEPSALGLFAVGVLGVIRRRRVSA